MLHTSNFSSLLVASRPSSPSAMLEGPTFAPSTVPPVVSMAVVTVAAASAACRRSASRLPSSPCSWSCSFCFPALPVAGPATYLAVCLRFLAGRVSFPSSRLFSPAWSPSRAPLAVCSPLCSPSSSPRCRRFPPALAASSFLSPRFLRWPSPSSSQWVVLSVIPIALVVLPLPASRRLSASSLSFSSASRCRCRLRRQQIHAFAAHSISRILSFLSFCPSLRRSVSAATRSFLSASSPFLFPSRTLIIDAAVCCSALSEVTTRVSYSLMMSSGGSWSITLGSGSRPASSCSIASHSSSLSLLPAHLFVAPAMARTASAWASHSAVWASVRLLDFGGVHRSALSTSAAPFLIAR